MLTPDVPGLTPERWQEIILRRSDLIYKKNRQGLDGAEREALEVLELAVDAVALLTPQRSALPDLPEEKNT